MKTHILKTLPEHFEQVLNRFKKFEVRYNDRDFKVDDILILREYEKGRYTGRALSARVPYILDDTLYCKDNFVIMSVENIMLLDGVNGMKIEEAIKAFNDRMPGVTMQGTTDLYKTAIEALEKQIPKEPKIHCADSKFRHYECPSCSRLYWEHSDYCDCCGQALKWD